MKLWVRHTAGLALAAGLFAGQGQLLQLARADRRMRACREVRVGIADSLERPFVKEADVRAYLAEYGTPIGQRRDCVNLAKIEALLDRRSAIRKSEAYIDGEGVLHVEVTQREPFVKFQKGETGFYADREGFLFPLMENYECDVPLVEGAVPLRTGQGFKGEPASERERLWLSGMIAMAASLRRQPVWAENFKRMQVLPNGEIVLIPLYGRERFVFGTPENVSGKLRKIEEYYEYIAPSKMPGCYEEVDVRFAGQIVCRRQGRMTEAQEEESDTEQSS